MVNIIIYTIIAYLMGSISFARIANKLFAHNDIILSSNDKNPGTTNAFIYGGFIAGLFTLLGDLLKGIIPIFIYLHSNYSVVGVWPIIFATVLGHIFPIYYNFHGGKGICTTFGTLIGLLPIYQPLCIYALTFVFFCTIVQIKPNFNKTIITNVVSIILMILFVKNIYIVLGFISIAILECVKLLLSSENKSKTKIKFIWSK